MGRGRTDADDTLPPCRGTADRRSIDGLPPRDEPATRRDGAGWFSLALLLFGIATLGLLGPRWACAAVVMAFGARALAAMLVLRSVEGIRIQDLLGALIRPMLACLPMVAAVLAVHSGARLYGWGSPGVILTAEITVGAFVYVGSALLIARYASVELLRLCRNALLSSVHPSPMQTGGVR